MSKIITTTTGETFRRVSRWITVKNAYDMSKRNSLYDYCTDENGYRPYNDQFNPENGIYCDYFRFRGCNWAMNRFYGIGSIAVGGTPYTFIDTDGKLSVIGAVDMDGNIFDPYYLEIDEYGEHVRVYERVI